MCTVYPNMIAGIVCVLIIVIIFAIQLQKSCLKKYRNANLIVDNLWLGNWEAAIDADFLDRAGIRGIICLNRRMKDDETVCAYMKRDIKELHIGIDDQPGEPIRKEFAMCYQFIENMRGAPVLIHCTAGISRSATIMTSYLMRKKHMTFEDAYDLVQSRRPIVSVNPGFRQQLLKYEKELRAQV